MRISLIQLPTVALRIHGLFDYPAFLEPQYSRIIPASQARVAALLRKDLPVHGIEPEISIHDLRIMDPDREEVYDEINWEGHKLECVQIGESFDTIDDVIAGSEVIGLTSHFRKESQIVGRFIAYARRKNPKAIIIVGGADTSYEPERYLVLGADYVMHGNLDVELFAELVKNKRNQPKVVRSNKLISINSMPPLALDLLPYLSEYSDTHDGPLPDRVYGPRPPIGFIYFTRGCVYDCNFCMSANTSYEAMSLDNALAHIDNYARYGVKTLDVVDDNLLLQAHKPEGRERILQIFRYMRQQGFSWEFPNGLVVGDFMKKGVIDEELMWTLFGTDFVDHKIVGGWGLYFPIEKFSIKDRNELKKLKKLEDQLKIMQALSQQNLLRIAFGVILSPNVTEDEERSILCGYRKVNEIFKGNTKIRCGIFHPIPIAELQYHPRVYDFSEGYTFYLPLMRGTFPPKEQLRRRLELTRQIDPENFEALQHGNYTYS